MKWAYALLVTVLASTASAAPDVPGPSASADAKEAARALFEKSLPLFEEGHWDAALGGFLASRNLYPARGNTQNAAMCMEKLARYDEAIELLEALQTFSLTPTEQAVVDREIRRLLQ